MGELEPDREKRGVILLRRWLPMQGLRWMEKRKRGIGACAAVRMRRHRRAAGVGLSGFSPEPPLCGQRREWRGNAS
jgi:hypothetical protein